MKWSNKEIWTTRAGTFTIEVSRHESGYGIDKHRWCVYAYIYPNHPLFKKIKGESTFQGALGALPLHGGCSYLQRHYSHARKCTSVQIGADYNHLYDERYTFMATKEDAVSVFNDAEELFELLDQMAKNSVDNK